MAFRVARESSIDAGLYDLVGHRLATIASGTYSAGEHRLPLNDLSSFPAASYLLRLSDGVSSVVTQFAIIHFGK